MDKKKLFLLISFLAVLFSLAIVISALEKKQTYQGEAADQKEPEPTLADLQPRYDNPGQGLFQCHATDAVSANYVKGGNVLIFWGDLQPNNQNELNNQALTQVIKDIKQTGKKVYLHFMIYPSDHPINKVYPQWLRLNDNDQNNDLVNAVYIQTGWNPYPNPAYIIYPQPWDQKYQQYLRNFFTLLNQAFEQAGVISLIEYIEPALGGQWASTNLYLNNINHLDLWVTAAGCANQNYQCLGTKFTEGVDKIVDLYAEAFPKTSLMMIGGNCLKPECDYKGWSRVFEKYGLRVMRKNAGLGADDASCGLRLAEFQPFCYKEAAAMFTKCGQETRGAGIACQGSFFNPQSTCGTNRKVTTSPELYQKVYEDSLKREVPSYYCMYKNDLNCRAYQATNKQVADRLGSQITLTNNSGFGSDPFTAGQTQASLTLTWTNSGSSPLAAPLKSGFLPKWPASSYKFFLEFETSGQIKDYLELDINPGTQNWDFIHQTPATTKFNFTVPASLGGANAQSQTTYLVYGGLTDPNGEKQRFALINSDANNDPQKRRYLLSNNFVVKGKGTPTTPTPTATSGPRPTATLTPTPTPTSSPEVTSLTFKIKLQALTGQKSNQNVQITLAQENEIKYQQEVITQTNNQGLYLGQIANILPGTYKILIKAPFYLQKRFGNVEIKQGANAKDFSAKTMLAGDFNNNNVLNVLDLALILQQYTDLEVPITSQNQKYDINQDNVLNIFDLGLVLQNYTELEVRGDE